MQDVKIPTSDSYRPSKIERLKDSEYAAAYITAILEEKDPEPELLAWAIKDIIDARVAANNLTDEAELTWKKFAEIVTESGSTEIYRLIGLLDVLGFRLAVTIK